MATSAGEGYRAKFAGSFLDQTQKILLSISTYFEKFPRPDQLDTSALWPSFPRPRRFQRTQTEKVPAQGTRPPHPSTSNRPLRAHGPKPTATKESVPGLLLQEQTANRATRSTRHAV